MAARRRERISYLGNEEVEVVSKSRLGSSTFVSIEYPAILSTQPAADVADGVGPLNGNNGGSSSTSTGAPSRDDQAVHPALRKALESLAPVPHPYATANLGLENIQRVVQSKQKSIECRLFHDLQGNPASSSRDTTPDPDKIRSDNSIYRHGLHGDFVNTHNIVLKLRKRTWRRKRRNQIQDVKGAGAEEQVMKEYSIEPLGLARQTARFRTMADYLYDPGQEENIARDSSVLYSPIQSKALNLHDSLRKMDVAALRDYNIEEDEDEYTITDPDGNVVTNVRMPPVPLFDKSDGPYTYGFRQNSSSAETPGPVNVNGKWRKRYVNSNRKEGTGPEIFDLFAKKGTIRAPPKRPNFDLSSQRLDDRLLRNLAICFDERPMWSRLALLNQFNKADRTKLANQKYHIAASCYTINDGCWRDNLVRFGYDPRTDRESRFYQRIVMQAKGRGGRPAQKTGTTEQANADDENEEDEDAQMDVDDEELKRKSHIFDGVTRGLTRGNYLLIDIEDEIVRKLIDMKDPEHVVEDASQVQKISGWYTPQHWARIRAILKLRSDALVFEGRPATQEECDAELKRLDAQFAKASARRAGSGTNSPEATRGARQESASDQDVGEGDLLGWEDDEEEPEDATPEQDPTDSSDEEELQQPRQRTTARRGSGRRNSGRRLSGSDNVRTNRRLSETSDAAGLTNGMDGDVDMQQANEQDPGDAADGSHANGPEGQVEAARDMTSSIDEPVQTPRRKETARRGSARRGRPR